MSPESSSQRSPAPASPFVVLQQDAHLVQIVNAALTDATRRAGPHLACRPGCTQCCYGAFAINPLDALRLRAAMQQMAVNQPEQAASIAERANRYLAEFSPSFPGNQQTGILGTSDEDQEAFEDFANQAPCPALNPESGLCEMYDARPMTCRVFGPPVRSVHADEEGLAVCELCFTEASETEILAAEMHPPREEEQALLEAVEQLAAVEQLEAVEEAVLAPDRDSVVAGNSAQGDTVIAWCLAESAFLERLG